MLRGNRPAASNLWAILGLHRFSAGQFPDKSDPRRAKVCGWAQAAQRLGSSSGSSWVRYRVAPLH